MSIGKVEVRKDMKEMKSCSQLCVFSTLKNGITKGTAGDF